MISIRIGIVLSVFIVIVGIFAQKGYEKWLAWRYERVLAQIYNLQSWNEANMDSFVTKHFHLPDSVFNKATNRTERSPDRLSDVSWATFEYYTRMGIPFIITDAVLPNWTCNSLRDRFPDQEVTTFSNAYSDEIKQPLGAPGLFDVVRPVNLAVTENYNPLLPRKSSIYWNVKPQSDNGQSILGDMVVPYFLKGTSEANVARTKSQLELFFGFKNTGVAPHTDQICDYIMSAQVQGKKHWTLAMLPNIDRLEELNKGFHYDWDMHRMALQARMADDSALYSFDMHAGEVLVIPPGLVHSTQNMDDECSLSYSLQFEYPLPDMFMRAFMPRLMRDAEATGMCFHREWMSMQWGSTEFFYDLTSADAVASMTPDKLRDALVSLAPRFFSYLIELVSEAPTFVDDDLLDRSEVAFLLRDNITPRRQRRVSQLSTWVDGFFAFNDANNDTLVDAYEYSRHFTSLTFDQYQAVVWFYGELAKSDN